MFAKTSQNDPTSKLEILYNIISEKYFNNISVVVMLFFFECNR